MAHRYGREEKASTLNKKPGSVRHRLQMRRWSFPSVRSLGDNFKHRFAISSDSEKWVNSVIRSLKMKSSERARCQNDIVVSILKEEKSRESTTNNFKHGDEKRRFQMHLLAKRFAFEEVMTGVFCKRKSSSI
jgi:hypothetical protein